jgi:hypothetical protein
VTNEKEFIHILGSNEVEDNSDESIREECNDEC